MKQLLPFVDNPTAVTLAAAARLSSIAPSTTSLQGRYRGALVGVHVGDAIGAPYETWGPAAIVADIEARAGLSFFDYPNPWWTEGDDPGFKTLPGGRPTDDSDQTANLCESLLVTGGVDAAHLRNELRTSVVDNQSRLWRGKAIGAGGTTRDMLSDDEALIAKSSQNPIGTNGSLMRCAPMALWVSPADSIEDWRDDIKTMSMVTHTNQHSIDACLMYTYVLCRVLAGYSKADAIAGEDESYIACVTRLKLADAVSVPYDPGAWPGRGSAEFSLYVALYAFLHSSSFAQGIELAVRVGGDTDTYAAITGGLLGAYYGYDAIPAGWNKAILGHDSMIDYADQLYKERAL